MGRAEQARRLRAQGCSNREIVDENPPPPIPSGILIAKRRREGVERSGGGHGGRIAAAGAGMYPSQPVAMPSRSFRHPDPQRPRQADREAAGGGREGSGGGHDVTAGEPAYLTLRGHWRAILS